ncbi:MAG: flagellar hook-associated protein FlgL [Candidatus Riflemargulisbacteria bacterium]
MRVTNNIMANNVLDNILRGSQTLSKIQDQLSSGKKIAKPSDDPTNINRVMGFREDISRMNQYLSNINAVKVNLDTTDGILFSLTEEINSVETSIGKYSNGALSGEFSAAIASDIENIFDGIMKTANSSLNGKYIFGGQNVTQAPFEVDGNKIRYNGTDNQKSIIVGDNESLDGSISGVDLFSISKMEGVKYSNSPDQVLYATPASDKIKITVGDVTTDITIEYDATKGMTLQDIVDSISKSGAEVKAMVEQTTNGYRLKMVSNYVGSDGEITIKDELPGGVFEKMGLLNTAGDFVGIKNDPKGGVLSTILSIKNKIQAGDSDISKEVADLTTGRDNVIKAHALVGIYVKRMEQRESHLTDLVIQQKTLTSSIEDIDYATLMMEYNKQMVGYQAALNVGAKIMGRTLLDYL